MKDGPTKASLLLFVLVDSLSSQEGTLNKFLIDDKGMLFLLAYGLPPLAPRSSPLCLCAGHSWHEAPVQLEVHTDDATRAVLSCFDIAARSGVGFEGIRAWGGDWLCNYDPCEFLEILSGTSVETLWLNGLGVHLVLDQSKPCML